MSLARLLELVAVILTERGDRITALVSRGQRTCHGKQSENKLIIRGNPSWSKAKFGCVRKQLELVYIARICIFLILSLPQTSTHNRVFQHNDNLGNC